MKKRFNVTGTCIPQKHYMVNIQSKIEQIEALIENDNYFTINRARQFGKTTTLFMLWKNLKDKYIIINISFEGMGDESFSSEAAFVRSFYNRAAQSLKYAGYSENLIKAWKVDKEKNYSLEQLRDNIKDFCEKVEREVLLFIDEVDKSSDNQLFINFLGILRELYLSRAYGAATFKSVILTSVYDIKNLKLKLRPDDERKYNSPWNIAVDFDVDMNFGVKEISTMLEEYEKDENTGMDIETVSEEIFRYTSGYPYLVSLICKYLDEKPDSSIAANEVWSVQGVNTAVRDLLKNSNTLFDDIIKNVENNSKFKKMIQDILINGKQVSYVISNREIAMGKMFDIIAEKDGLCCVSNIIFETYLYNHFIIEQDLNAGITKETRNMFITEDGNLDMDLVMKKFAELMQTEYRDSDEKFLEKQGRLLFLCFIKPIINGTGHYVVEAQTRDNKRMDIVIFYGKKEYIIELKIWHGELKHGEGIEQLAEYMDIRKQNKGWLLTFCFNINKEIVKEKYTSQIIEYEGKNIVSVIV